MRTLPRFLASTLTTVFLLSSASADPPEHYVSAGEAEVTLKSASATSVTLKLDPLNTPPVLNRTVTPGKKKDQPDQTLEFTSDIKVRLLHLPVQKDDKGVTIVRTPEELMKLKGNSTLPGYEAEVSDLKPNQTVKVFLVKAKKPAAGEENKLYVKRIYIEKSPAASTPTPMPEKKK